MDQARADVFETTRDRSLYWTLSLYVDREAVERVLGAPPDATTMRRFQARYLASQRLRDAIEPLFNDIADRERLGSVDDFLLDTPGPLHGEDLTAEGPDHIDWETEGVRFRSYPPGLARPRPMRLRRFWYAHLNGAFSYHLSFRIDYEHAIGDFYFLSLLQKAAAPKEFSVKPRDGPAWGPTDAGSGLFPAENLFLTDAAAVRDTFWRLVARRFEDDAAHLFRELATHLKRPAPDAGELAFKKLVRHSPFIEVPGLDMPMSRFMFFFRDARLFKRLLPPVDPETGRRASRALLVQEECYAPYPARIQAALDALPPGSQRSVTLDDAYWDWAATRPEYASLTGDEIERLRREKPAFEENRADCLQYLFLSGFNQNIIDFMNQDASEVLDSTDPIYPTPDQNEESFFVRFANPRALITFVQNSRSLEAGNDYIGTCPYAFLIHVVSMHNEFLARDYEAKTFELVAAVRDLNERRRYAKAADAFYKFRMTTYAEQVQHRYGAIFRYDTEQAVFEKLEALRGTTRKAAFLESLVQNAESQTRDLEARITKSDEQAIGFALGALGLFGLFQLMFQWADVLGEQGSLRASWSWPFIRAAEGGFRLSDWIAVIALDLSVVFTAVLIGYVIWLLVRRFRR
jgi:hypothetical protein